MLRVVTGAMENRFVRPLLMPGLLSATGVKAFRALAPEAAPTTHPLMASRRSPVAEPEPEGVDAAAAVSRAAGSADGPGFQFASIRDYAKAYRNGETSPEDVAQKVIAAVEASNRSRPPLRGVIKCDADEVRRQAAECGKRLAEGRARSILEGVPVAIKDELDMLPYTTEVGTRFLGKEAPDQDATPVARLRAAGALLIGKTNMFEIGISPTGNNPIHGFARTPYNLNHDAGGSSGGSGAAVGSGIVPLALGADGGGSIRVPSAHCGIVGLKPTFGRVSEFGAAPLCWSVAHVGPMGATALDTAVGYAVCAGPDPKDPMTLGQSAVHLKDFHHLDLTGVILGVHPDWFEDASPEIVETCRETLRVLEDAGAVVREVTVAGLDATRVAHAVTILTEMAAAMEAHYGEHRRDFCHATRLNLVLGRQFTSLDYVRAQRVRTESLREWSRVFSEVDAVMTPTTACPSPHLDPATVGLGESHLALLTDLMRFVVCANFCGLPAISFPAGYLGSGLPVGMQAIGPHWQEHLLLRLAHVAEQRLDRRKPAMHFGMLTSG
jgi:Asp-tRNA(Asn)/Glu-tRNA(Gln) amidotransferase A subunit family amidase